MKLNAAIAKRVIELKEESGLNLYAFGKLVGVASSTLDDVIKCKNDTVKIRIIFEITQGLNISLKEFFDRPYFDKENLID
ncbi:MAG: hypothetical protein R3Y32_06955 [Bacillota bacterium]